MLKRLSILLALLFILPVQAGEYEKALEQNEKVFLYLYSSNCSYCIKFEPIYKKIVSEYGNDFKFIKINTDTTYGRTLAYKLQARFVPFVMLTDKTKNENALVAPMCITNLACAEKVLRNYK